MTRRARFIDGVLSRQVCVALEATDVTSRVGIASILVDELVMSANFRTFAARQLSRILKAVLTAQARGVTFPALDSRLHIHGWGRIHVILERLQDRSTSVAPDWGSSVQLLSLLSVFLLRRQKSPPFRSMAGEMIVAAAHCYSQAGKQVPQEVLDSFVRMVASVYASMQPMVAGSNDEALFQAFHGMVSRNVARGQGHGQGHTGLAFGADILVCGDGEADVVLLIDRSDILGSSFSSIMGHRVSHWERCQTMDVQFIGETGVGEGVARDWIGELCTQVFYLSDLFTCCHDDPAVVHPNPALPDDSTTRSMMDFSGRVLGIARRLGIPAGVHLSVAAVAWITGLPLETRMLAQLDPVLATSCAAIRWMGQDDDVDLGDFVSPGLGCDLFPGGNLVSVGPVERAAFSEMLAARHVCGLGRDSGLWIRRGLQYVMSQGQCVEADRMDAPEFNATFGGQGVGQVTDVDEWRRHTQVCSATHASWAEDAAGVLFELVRQMLPCDQRQLLRFWIGSSSLPHGGFRSLPGSLKLVVVNDEGSGRLPSSHTCVRTLVLPVPLPVTPSFDMRSAIMTCLVSMDIDDSG